VLAQTRPVNVDPARIVVRGGRGRARGRQVGRRRGGDGAAATRGRDHGLAQLPARAPLPGLPRCSSSSHSAARWSMRWVGTGATWRSPPWSDAVRRTWPGGSRTCEERGDRGRRARHAWGGGEEQGPAADVWALGAMLGEEARSRAPPPTSGRWARRELLQVAYAQREGATLTLNGEPPPQPTGMADTLSLTLNHVGLARVWPTMACRASWIVTPPAGARPSLSNVPCWPGFFYFVLGRAACHLFRVGLVVAQQARPKLTGLLSINYPLVELLSPLVLYPIFQTIF
jgi:hypothetical protein